MRDKTRPLEKVVQQQIAHFLTVLGAKVYTIGTRRPAGDFQGTRQTPGLPDLLAFVPTRWLGEPGFERVLLAIEVKAKGGRLRPEQEAFRDLCGAACVEHVVGGLDEVIAWCQARGLVNANQIPWYRQPAAAAKGNEP